MDVIALLSRSGKVNDADLARKSAAIELAYAQYLAINPRAELASFLEMIHPSIYSTRFGLASEDFHYTNTFSLLSQYHAGFDPFVGATLNHVMLSLNFQTRIMSNREPEAFVFSGDPITMGIAMMNSNELNGLHIIHPKEQREVYGGFLWPAAQPELRLRDDVIRTCDVGRLAETLGARQIGCIALDLSFFESRLPSNDQWIDPIRGKFSPHSIYVLAGPDQTLLRVAKATEEDFPDASIYLRTYGTAGPGWRQIKAILIIRGLNGIPRSFFGVRYKQPCHFQNAATLIDKAPDKIGVVEYFEAADGSKFETIQPKQPFAVLSSSPLPLEVRHRLCDRQYMHHTAAILAHGILIPHRNDDRSAMTFLSATGDWDIADDFGDLQENHRNTTIYRDGVIQPDGTCRSAIESKVEIQIDGPAMPLFFTPDLHLWHSHFMIQCLPKLKILRDLGIDAKIIVPFDLRRKQREMLKIVGYAEDRLVFVPRNAIVKTGKLVVTRPWPLVFTEYTIGIYDEIMHSLGCSSVAPTRRILISREERTAWRNFLTYPAIRQFLVEDYGFEVIRPEKLTLQDEVAIFRNARMLVGAEGAGMYGACFMQREAACISIGDEDYIMPILGTLAQLRGFSLGCVLGESMRSDPDIKRRRTAGHADFMVDPRMVAAMVDKAISLLDSTCGST
jgi:hypothetical protein